jgi:hypothetical protein
MDKVRKPNISETLGASSPHPDRFLMKWNNDSATQVYGCLGKHSITFNAEYEVQSPSKYEQIPKGVEGSALKYEVTKFCSYMLSVGSRDGAVGRAAGNGLKDREGQDFSLPHVVQTGSADHPASYARGIRSSFPGVKRPGCEAATHFQLLPRWKMYGFIHPLPQTYSWRSA